MGRNFHSVCHNCKVQLMHFRGKENQHMQQFANNHSKHEQATEVINDYVTEPPEEYKDEFDLYNPEHDK